MEPIRKADGYTLDGVKKYKRYFQIKKKLDNLEKKDETIKTIVFDDIETNVYES